MRGQDDRARSERRRRRRLVAKAARISNPTLDARLLDFSPEGLAVETTQGLRLGQRLVFRVERSGGPRGPDRFQSLVGVVRWCRLRTTRPVGEGQFEPVFRAGLALETKPRGDD